MTSITQTSSGAKANLVSSSPELLTRPASKPDDRSNSSTGELRTLVGTGPKVAAASRRWSLGAKFLPFPSPHSAFSCERDFLLANAQKSSDFLRDFEIFYFRFNSPSDAETTAEILLRFAETSQQTLRQISLLPTT